MQIHELNNRKEVKEDVAGPGSIFNVGKQVLKDPKALLSNPAMGQAKKDATQAYAANQAAKLAKQGYTVASGPNTQTSQQQLAQVKSNPGVQQMVKNLAAQWKPVGAAAASKLSKSQQGSVAEAIVPIENPLNIKDPKERQLYDLFLKQQASTNVTTDTSAAKEAQAKVNQNLTDFSNEFQTWVGPKLRALGVNFNAVMQDPWAAKTIRELLTAISVESLANPESPKVNSLVEEFFNVTFAANQAARAGTVPSAPTSSVTAPGAVQAKQDDSAVLNQYGLTIPQGQLDALGQSMRRAAKGGTVIRNTGNELLNAVARLAGFQIG